MARRVDEVELIALAVLRGIIKPHGLRFNGDAALALNIHIVQNLFRHFTIRQPAGQLNQPVGQCRFTVIDMRNNGKIADMGFTTCTHKAGYSTRTRPRQCGIWGGIWAGK